MRSSAFRALNATVGALFTCALAHEFFVEGRSLGS